MIKNLERSKQLLIESTSVAHFQAAHLSRLRSIEESEAQTERTKQDRMFKVMDWLSPTSCYADHEELQRKRKEFPHTTRWIFEEPSMRLWLQSDENANSKLWICGIPGAGRKLFRDLQIEGTFTKT